MKKWFKQLFSRNRTANPEGSTPSAEEIPHPSNLLIDDQVLAQEAQRHNKWEIDVASPMSPADKQIFFRNLIKLTFVHKIQRSDIAFRVHGPFQCASVTADLLKQRGFSNIMVVEEDSDGKEAEYTDNKVGDESPSQPLLLKEYMVAGLQYHVDPKDTLWDTLVEGDPVTLQLEPDNPHDDNAIAIIYGKENPRLLGYVPRNQNTTLAVLLKQGYGDCLNSYISAIFPQAQYFARLNVATLMLPAIKNVNNSQW